MREMVLEGEFAMPGDVLEWSPELGEQGIASFQPMRSVSSS